MPETIYDIADRYRRDLIAKDRQAARDILEAYGRAYQQIRVAFDGLVARIEQQRQSGQQPTVTDLLTEDRWRALMAQVEDAMRRFADFAAGRIEDRQRESVENAERHSRDLIEAGMGSRPPGATFLFNRLPRGALESLIGFTRDGSPLKELFDSFGPETRRKIEDVLTVGLATGMGPRQMATLLRDALGDDLTRALRIARTEPLRAYREATRASFEANEDVVKGWIWRANLRKQPPPCIGCMALHGKFFETWQPLESHPVCRCMMIPVTKDWSELGFPGRKEQRPEQESAETFFNRLPYEEKIKLIHPAVYEVYRIGGLRFNDLGGKRKNRDRRWGATVGPYSLKSIFGEDSKRYFLDKARKVKEQANKDPRWFQSRDFMDRSRWEMEDLLGRRSNWSGRLNINDDPRYYGAKDWNCDITLSETARREGWTRVYSTLIHELGHSFSRIGEDPPYYRIAVGWEEGPVEALKRALFPKIIKRLGLDKQLPELVAKNDVVHPYNKYVVQIERIANTLNVPVEKLAADMLDIRIPDRRQWIEEHLMEKYPDPETRQRLLEFMRKVDRILKEQP